MSRVPESPGNLKDKRLKDKRKKKKDLRAKGHAVDLLKYLVCLSLYYEKEKYIPRTVIQLEMERRRAAYENEEEEKIEPGYIKD